MSFMDFIKRRKTQSKEVTKAAAEIFDRHSMMISNIVDLEQGYNCYPEGWRHTEWSHSVDANGQVNGLTKTTKYADGVTPADYEFLVYKGLNESGQMNTQYYDVKPSGDFSTPHNLAAFTLRYNANVNGQYIPCEATIRTNGASTKFVPVDPREVKPMDPEVDKKACMPDPSDITHILTEYARVMGIELDNAVDGIEEPCAGFKL